MANALATNAAPGSLTRPAHFRVDPKLAALLGEGYRSAEYALKELVDNAWDADAATVRITLPAAVSGEPIVVDDDGTGMTEAEVRRDYLAVASSRQSRKGEVTIERRRPVKGRKGIGKFAGLMIADMMVIETRCRGARTRLVIRKEDLLAVAGGAGAERGPYEVDLETIDLPLEVTPCPPHERGTRVTLSGLAQVFDPPSPDRFKPILMVEYGRQADFALLVNEEAIGVEDIPGETFRHETELPEVGRVRLHFTVSNGKRPLRQSGIAIRATKVVAKPTVFGLDTDDEIPPKLLRKVYGELEAPGLEASITGDFGDVVETRAFAAVSGWAAVHLKQALTKVYATEVNLARARLAKQLNERLAGLPAYRRQFAEQRIKRVLTTMYDEPPERVETVVSVTLDAIEHDDYYTVVEAINDAKDTDVATLAAALGQFGLVDMAHMADQARGRLQFLDQLDDLIRNPATREQELHVALERNLWVLGAEYALMASNTTLRRMIEGFTEKAYSGKRAKERPDLLLLSSVRGSYQLIEFKRPSLEITRQHEGQAIAYRDELIRTFPEGIDVTVIGGRVAKGLDRTYGDQRFMATSYTSIVNRARNELRWLLDQLTEAPMPDAVSAPRLALDAVSASAVRASQPSRGTTTRR